MDTPAYHIPTVALIQEGGGDDTFLSLEGTIELPAWKAFQRKTGRFSTLKKPDNYQRIRLSIGGDEVVEHPAITREHVTAYDYVLRNQEQIKAHILDALLAQYPELQEQYGYEAAEATALMPDIDHISSFEALIELSDVYLLNVSKEDTAYVGFSFWCTWDEEHGLGVMTHKDRVVKIGGADTAFLTWIATNDLKMGGTQ